MASELHENIVDDLRFEFINFIHDNSKYQGNSWENRPGLIGDSCIFHFLYPSMKHSKRDLHLEADFYIELLDGYGPIVVEVGKMKDGKWNRITIKRDKGIVRILRAGFDKSIWLLNPRNTRIERDMMEYFHVVMELAV